MIEQIAAALAHEVKNPLTLVKASVELLESNDERADTKKNYKIIKQELKKINEIILEFIDITQPVIEENFDFIYVSDVIYQTSEKYKKTYENKINFILDINCEDMAILGVEKSISILFDNVIKNAIEAIEEDGQIVITTEINEIDDSIIITTADTGVGIPEDVANKIHENFFTTKEFGSGLGLSICKKIVQDHKGTFDISNNSDSFGCTVKIIFPLYKCLS